MTSFPDPVKSTALVPYNPNLPHIAIRSCLEAVTDRVSRQSLELAKYELSHLRPVPIETETDFEPHIMLPPTVDPQKVLDARPRRLFHILPSLSGPHTVGHSSLSLKIPKYSPSLNDSEIGIEIFAPTNNAIGKKLLMHLCPGHPLEKGLSTKQIQTLHTHAIDRLEPVKKMPFLIFSHGWGVESAAYRPLLEELASHGYVILSLNHPSSCRPYPEQLSEEDASKVVEHLALIQANNIRFVVDQLRLENLEEARDLGCPTQIILAGHSLGGIASILVSQGDSHIAGCINLDGALVGDKKTNGLEMPVLTIFADHLKDLNKGSEEEQRENQKWKTERYDPMVQTWKTFHDNSKHPRAVKIEGIGHMDFSVFPLLDWLVGEETLGAGLKAHAVTSREMVNFMNSVCGVK